MHLTITPVMPSEEVHRLVVRRAPDGLRKAAGLTPDAVLRMCCQDDTCGRHIPFDYETRSGLFPPAPAVIAARTSPADRREHG